MSRVFANSPGDYGSTLGHIKDSVIPKIQKMVLDTAFLNTQHYKVRIKVNTQHYKVKIKGKVEQSREWSSALPFTSV